VSRMLLLGLAAGFVLATSPDAAEARKLRVPGVMRAVIGAPFALMRRGIPRVHPHTSRRDRTVRVALHTRAIEPATPERAAGRSASAYLEALGYALWPSEYKERFWSHGIGDLTARMFDGAGSGEARAKTPVRIAADGDVAAADSLDPACVTAAREGAAALLARIESLELSGRQRTALQDVRAAVMQTTADITDVTCSTEHPPTPAARLRRMKDELWAVRYAQTRVRPLLEAFLATLSETQDAALDKPIDAKAADNADPPSQQPAVPNDTAVAACGPQNAAALAWPARELRRALRPSAEQQARLERLRMTVLGMAQYLAKSCPAKIAATPLQRLDAANNRLRAMIYAATVLQSATNGVYACLDAGQQRRFSALQMR